MIINIKRNLMFLIIVLSLLGTAIFSININGYYLSQGIVIKSAITTGGEAYIDGQLAAADGKITDFGRTVVYEVGFTDADIAQWEAIGAANGVGASSNTAENDSSVSSDTQSSSNNSSTVNESDTSATEQNTTTSTYTNEEVEAAWEKINRVESTCTKAGYIEYTNSLTKETKTEELELAKHQYEETERTEPTCTEEGIVTYTCSVCGNTYNETLPATGHSYEWVTTKEAGLFTDGLEEEVCSVCGEKSGATHTLSAKSPIPLVGIVGFTIVVCGAVVGIIVYKKNSSRNK